MSAWNQYFKGKKVTLMGLGLLGRGVNDAIFLASQGAKLTITDLKTRAELKPSLKKLEKYAKIKYTLGKHRVEDFTGADMVLKAAGVPLDSPYILAAIDAGAVVEMDESLFAKLAPKVRIIGVTGTRGKTTTTLLIYEIFKLAGERVHLAGNIRGTATLPLLEKVREGDMVVMELSSWQLQGFAEAKISPSISVFTNFMPDHMNYYQNDIDKYFTDKSYIYKFQKEEDTLILGPSMKPSLIKGAQAKIIKARIKSVPKNWKPLLQGKHNLENIACALEVAKVLKIRKETVREVVENFRAPAGRLELVKEINNIKIYNDTNACTPEATEAALMALGASHWKKIVLIVGGTDKNLEIKKLVSSIKKYARAVVLLPGNGTNRLEPLLRKIKTLPVYHEVNLKNVVERARELALAGEIILFSPAFTSFGMFSNEYDRGDQFMKIVKKLK